MSKLVLAAGIKKKQKRNIKINDVPFEESWDDSIDDVRARNCKSLWDSCWMPTNGSNKVAEIKSNKIVGKEGIKRGHPSYLVQCEAAAIRRGC